MRAYARLSHDERRQQLLDVGLRLFTERPYDDFSMEEAAETAGVSKGLLYHYFPTKRDYYMSVIRAATDEMLRLTMPPPHLDRFDQLRIGLDAYLSFVEDHAAAYRAVLRGGIGSDPEVVAIADDFRRTIYARIADGLGLRRAAAPQELALLGWIGFVEAVSLEWVERRRPARARLIGLLVDTLADVVDRWGIT